MYHYLLVFNDRSETRGAGFKDEDVLKVDDFYVARIESEDPLVQPMLGWCVAYAGLWRPMLGLCVAYAGLWRPTDSYALQTVNLGANCRGEIHACVKKAMNLPELKTITV